MKNPIRLVTLVLPLALAGLAACHAGARVGPAHAGGGISDNSQAAKTNAKAPTPDKTAIAQNR